MANVKITELTAATALAGTDVLPIVDVGADATKKVSVSDLLRNLPDGTASAPALAFADDQNTGVLSPGDNSLAFATSGTQRLVIDSSGNVGIGTTSPSQLLDLSSSGNAVTRLNSGSSNTTGVILSRGGTEVARISSAATGTLTFSTGSSATERLRIDSSGRVGIGTSSPSRILQIKASSANTAQIALIDNDSSNEIWQVGNQSDGDGFMALRTDEGTTSVLFDASGTNYINGGNVGIGTSSPGSKVHVFDSNPEVRLQSSGTSTACEYSMLGRDGSNVAHKVNIKTSDSALTFGTGGSSGNSYVPSERMRIDSSGNVGIGNTSMSSYNGSSNDLVIGNHTGAHGLTIATQNNTAGYIMFADGTTGQQQYEGQIEYNHSSNYMRINTAGNERMRITGSGDLCFGSAVGANNDGSGISIYNASNPRLSFRNSTTGNTTSDGSQLYLVNSDLYVTNNESANLIFRTNSTERVRIDSTGRLIIGATSAATTDSLLTVSNTGSACEFNVTSGNSAASVINLGDSDDYNIGRIKYDQSNDSLQFNTSNTERLRLHSNGKLTVAGVYNSTTTGGSAVYVESDGDLLRFTSSLKYKTDVETIEDARADAILNCRPVWYRSKCENDIKTEGSEKSDWGWYGFIAEEVAEIEPRLVNWATKDGVEQEDGSVQSVERDPANYEAEGVRYDNFVPLLVNLVKRQQAAIEALETKVAALEAQ